MIYAERGTWESYEQLVDDQVCGSDDLSYSFSDDNERCWMIKPTYRENCLYDGVGLVCNWPSS